MKLTFCGASRKVTGSCYLLETDSVRIVVDCGLSQGSRIADQENLDPFPFDPATVDVVLLTHAHLDHCGRIPRLVRQGFHGQILATEPTARLAQLMLSDSVHVLAEDAERHDHEPVYTEEDVAKTDGLFRGVAYHSPMQLGSVDSGVSVEFFDAGHILGSSMIRITVDDTQIVFSGDLGNFPVPLLNPTDRIGSADIVVMESTYGGREHEDRKTRSLLLASAMYEIATMKGVLMIPAFAMERTQEILYELNTLMNNHDIPAIPIYLDSPLAIKATAVFKEYAHYFNQESRAQLLKDDDLFSFPHLRTTLTSDESKAIAQAPGPKVIIAGSGMAQGGRIVHHIKNYISGSENQYLIVGYQVQGSLGRRLLDKAKTVRIHGKEIPVHAKVRAIGGYSAHADQPRLTEWVQGFDAGRLQKVFLTHGEEDQAGLLKEHLVQVGKIGADVLIPAIGDVHQFETKKAVVTV